MNQRARQAPGRDCVLVSRRPPFPVSARPADSPSCWKTAPARTSEFLADNSTKFMAAARKRPEIAGMTTTFCPACRSSLSTWTATRCSSRVCRSRRLPNHSGVHGRLFVNYFNRFGRQWQVYVQAEGDYRTRAENVGQFYVRNDSGDMVPLSALTRFEIRHRARVHHALQPISLGADQWQCRARLQSAQAMKALEEVFAQTMPSEMGYDYLACRSRKRRRRKAFRPSVIFGFSLLFVFLILAALV